jgi:hypothetical protein
VGTLAGHYREFRFCHIFFRAQLVIRRLRLIKSQSPDVSVLILSVCYSGLALVLKQISLT